MNKTQILVQAFDTPTSKNSPKNKRKKVFEAF
jgi:hypothetical protein